MDDMLDRFKNRFSNIFLAEGIKPGVLTRENAEVMSWLTKLIS